MKLIHLLLFHTFAVTKYEYNPLYLFPLNTFYSGKDVFHLAAFAFLSNPNSQAVIYYLNEYRLLTKLARGFHGAIIG
jgi:hypothetical protein